MYKSTHFILFLLLACLLSTAVTAQEITVDPVTQFCFSSTDFTSETLDDGIFVTAVPSRNIASVQYGDRTLKAGDALSNDALNKLTLSTSCVTTQTASIDYYTVADGKVTGMKSLKLSILPKKNDPPVAQDGSLETYRNITNTGTLIAEDPEGGSLTFTLQKAPKRGDIEIAEDGTFTYSPKKNKVGNDHFTYTVCDDAGNVSNEATISITIRTPDSKETYADMIDDPDHFKSLWLKDTGIFTGSKIGGQLCFQPDHSVSRGEFLVMTMNLVAADKTLIAASSGFSDEARTPLWMQPYITTALSNGIISGSATEDGLVFRPTDTMTQAEAASIIQNVLQLPSLAAHPVFSDGSETTLSWAEQAVNAISHAGINFSCDAPDDPFTRRDAATVLYQVNLFLNNSDPSRQLPWK